MSDYQGATKVSTDRIGWNWIYENSYIWTADEEWINEWSSQLNTQLKQLLKKIKAWSGFEPMTSAIPVQCSTNWAIKPTGSWSFSEFYIYTRLGDEMKLNI